MFQVCSEKVLLSANTVVVVCLAAKDVLMQVAEATKFVGDAKPWHVTATQMQAEFLGF